MEVQVDPQKIPRLDSVDLPIEPTTPKTPEPPKNDVEKDKSKQAKEGLLKKYKISKKTLVLGGVALTVIALLYVNLFVVSETPEPTPKGNKQTYIVKKDELNNEPIIYADNQYNFEVTYTNKVDLIKPLLRNANPLPFKFRYLGDKQIVENPEDAEINDGYSFSVLVHKDLTEKDSKQIAQNKRRNYLFNCGDLSTVTDVKKTYIDGLEAYTFEVLDCVVNYEETFITFGDFVYELLQVYKGDLGYKQAYKSEVEELQTTFKIINRPDAIVEWIEVQISQLKLTFKHPSLSSDCCKLEENLRRKVVERGIWGVENTYDGERDKGFDGMAMYEVEDKTKAEFSTFVEELKNDLIEDYRIVVGRNPVTLDEEALDISGKSAVRLKGYTWWVDEIVVIETSLKTNTSNKYLIIVKSEDSPGSFDETFEMILGSIVFE